LTEFLHVISSDELRRRLGSFARVPSEAVPLLDSVGRILAEDAVAPEDLPERSRSTVDGYAVRAEDTFGASESSPALLKIAGAVEMGKLSGLAIEPGGAAQIPTGGFLPSGADAVVMVEYTDCLDDESVEVRRPVTAGENVVARGDDVCAGKPVAPAGRRIRAQEIGLLAALGVVEVHVHRRPRVAVISTGDEVVPIDRKPQPGQIRDANAYALSALIRAAGAEPVPFPIVPDDAARLRDTLESALSRTDIVVLSGGSSVGTRDVMVDAVESLPSVELLAHGVAIRPGKPTLLARCDGKAIFGLPGHPVSALVIAQVFLNPFLRYLQGSPHEKGPIGERKQARLAVSMDSTIGMEEFLRVHLEKGQDGGLLAHPVFGKSSMLSTMVNADGLIVIAPPLEGLSRGTMVDVICW
jgi:molybdopterin molybdotransferase